MSYVDKIILNIARNVSNFYIKANHPHKAVRFLEIVLKISPVDGDLHLMLAAAQKAAGLRNESIRTVKNTIKVFPEDPHILWGLGVWLLQFGRPAEALEYLVQYLDNWTDKNNKGSLANVYAVIGLCHLRLKKWQEAEEFLYKSREMAPWDLDACLGIAALYNYTDRFEKIPALLNEYIQRWPDLYPPYYWMGQHYQYMLRRPKDSIEWYQKALEKTIDLDARNYCEVYVEASNLFDVLLNEYIDALIACGETSLILTEIQKYERYGIGLSVESRRRLIDVNVDLRDFAQAEKFAKSTPRALKNMPEILSSIAHMEYKRGEIDKALSIIRQALLIDAEFPQALATLGSIQVDNGMWDSAIKTYELLISRFPFVTNWLNQLGLCYLSINQIEMARKYYEEIVQYDELDADAWVDLGDVYLKLGNHNQAILAFQRALKYDWLDSKKRERALQAIGQLKSE